MPAIQTTPQSNQHTAGSSFEELSGASADTAMPEQQANNFVNAGTPTVCDEKKSKYKRYNG